MGHCHAIGTCEVSQSSQLWVLPVMSVKSRQTANQRCQKANYSKPRNSSSSLDQLPTATAVAANIAKVRSVTSRGLLPGEIRDDGAKASAGAMKTDKPRVAMYWMQVKTRHTLLQGFYEIKYLLINFSIMCASIQALKCVLVSQ
jgi:hypothetical protein